ncbi:MAG: UDP-N-acetylglucosamine 1-carboxyvinyltransferase [Oscillospiraceae bacterium]|nr:UDP-N-acetylglucosamine 1-carboxyvinyltransferase [Oscillospiraceae bacterium]
MKEIIIEGQRRLEGALAVQGAKNSVLPILAATLLHPGLSVLRGCPRLSDVDASIRILRHLGCSARWENDALLVDAAAPVRWDIPEQLMREMRSSVIFLGAILARMGRAELSYPGGCELGPRPIDLHLSALRALGAQISECGGVLDCSAKQLLGNEITLAISSVGATENAILAACGARGETLILNAAREPEIVDLQSYLNAIGCAVRGAGSSTIRVLGQQKTRDAQFTVMPDRIVAATYLACAAAAGGEIELTRVDPRHFSTVTSALYEAGCRIVCEADRVVLRSDGRLNAISTVRTAPYPGFPTDAQAILMVAVLKSHGASVFVENIFENRYRHVDELRRMGAQISVADRVAVVSGVRDLYGARVRASDLRGGAALMVAALSAQGVSVIGQTQHILRGYEDPVRDLGALGASVQWSTKEESKGE